MQNYDAASLDAELRTAGLLISGCASDGRIDWASPPTPAQLAAAQQVLAGHDPTSRVMREEAAAAALRSDVVLLGTGTTEMRLQRIERMLARLSK